MLQIVIPAVDEDDDWNEEKQEFIYVPARKEQTLLLEHSLVSISKWESKWCKPFLSQREKSTEEILDYIKCMTLTKNVDEDVYQRLINDDANIDKIMSYIEAPMTATRISGNGSKRGGGILTSEEIYYLMFANGIPLECEKWHINRLTTLIRVFGEKNAPSKKMSRKETASYYASLNAARRNKLHTKG